MDDEAFLSALVANPDDEVTRLVYADWLDERDDPGGAFIRLEREYVALPEEDERRTELKTRLQRHAGTLDPDWLRIVSRPALENCELRFKFECPRRWDQLTPTDDDGVRFCGACHKKVFYCPTIDVARLAALVGRCIAVSLTVARSPGDLELQRMTPDRMTLGIPRWVDLSGGAEDEASA